MYIETIHLADNQRIYYWKDHTFNVSLRGNKKKCYERTVIEKQLSEILGKKSKITHAKNGAPSLVENTDFFISVSHSKGWFAIYLSPHDAGVDIQIIRNSLMDGRYYFVNENEEKSLTLTKDNLHLIWGAKEAIYKKYKGVFTDLKNDVTILSIEHSNIIGMLNEHTEKCAFLKLDSVYLVWTIA